MPAAYLGETPHQHPAFASGFWASFIKTAPESLRACRLPVSLAPEKVIAVRYHLPQEICDIRLAIGRVYTPLAPPGRIGSSRFSFFLLILSLVSSTPCSLIGPSTPDRLLLDFLQRR